MKTKDCYVCVFYLSVWKLFILLLCLPFSFTAPAGQPYDQFMGYVKQHDCHLPEQINSFSKSTSNWDSLSKPLKPCKNDGEFEGHLLCSEIFENLINTTCHLPNVTIPAATFKLSSDVCADFGTHKLPIPQTKESVGAKLADDMFCKIACKTEYVELCQILLWSYEVRFFIANAIKHSQAFDGGQSVNSTIENLNAAHTKMYTTGRTVSGSGNIKVDAKDNKMKVLETPKVEDNQLNKKKESKLKKLDTKKPLEDEHTTEEAKLSSVLQNSSKMPQNLLKLKGNTLNEKQKNQNENTTEKQESQNENTPNDKQKNQDENTNENQKNQDENTNENQKNQNENAPNEEQESQNENTPNEEQGNQNENTPNKMENQKESAKYDKNDNSIKQVNKLKETLNNAKITENNTKIPSFPKIAVNLDSQINTSQINDEEKITGDVNKNLVEKGKEPGVLPETGGENEQVQPIIVNNDVSKNPDKVTNNQDASGSIVNSVNNQTSTSVKSASTVKPPEQNSVDEIKKIIPSTAEVTENTSDASSTAENYSLQNSKSSTLKPALENMEDANELPPPVQEQDQYTQDTGLSSPTEQQKVIAQDLFITSEKTDVGSFRDVQNDLSIYDDLMPRTFDGQVSREMHDIPRFPEEEDGHFFFYFLTIIFVLMAGYLIFHNKQKIIALIVEGRHERRRRSYSAGYKKLETK